MLKHVAGTTGNKNRLLKIHEWVINNARMVEPEAGNITAVSFMPSIRGPKFNWHPLVSKKANRLGLPPEKVAQSPEFSYSGTCWANPEEIVCMTTSWSWVIDQLSWRSDGFTFWIDADGRPRIGGVERYETEAVHHNKFFMDLKKCIDRSPAYTGKYAVTVEEGLHSLSEVVMAMLGADNLCPDNSLTMPRLWYGFLRENQFKLEQPTFAFKDAFVNLIQSWLLEDSRPGFHPVTDRIPADVGSTLGVAMSYNQYSYLLGEAMPELTSLLWKESVLYFDGLYWLPSDYLWADSVKPHYVGNHTRKIVTFPFEMMGRETYKDAKEGGPQYDYLCTKFQLIAVPAGSKRYHMTERLAGVDRFGTIFRLTFSKK